ncbi:sugar transferase [Adlercreutzia sp. ZJ138]|uniref:sugar transferase n=1 Tax=Adlercreutzia sp. ZJ138 TaxID=2709405 RepID=UPI0013ED3711|nr:sugar transferase [Adlercreutzia sp. ZJ138]
MLRNLEGVASSKEATDSASVESAPAVYGRTATSAQVREELQLDGRYGYRFIKRTFDIAVSGCGLIALSWLIAGTAVAVKVTSPGPVLFKQRRVGKGKKLFCIYKFRTMRIDTPDLPSHMIDANEWMTPIGATLRKYSLDELPQLINILKGDMSVVGPRPSLWSQFDLVSERDKYGANEVRPGLTGWAQINGRDELTIEAKSAFDGEYMRRRGIAFDFKCFLGTFSKLSGSEVVETTVPGHEGEGAAQ